MRIEKRTVDLNAYISDLECVVKAVDNKKQLSFSFRNMNYGTVVAVRLSCVAYDSFDDKIQFDGNDFLEVKRADLQIEPLKRANFSVDVDKYDLKRIEVSATQIVYADGEKVVPKEPKVIEYEVEILSSSWSPDEHFEKDALTIMREKNDKAICFPKLHPEGWICVCGTLNTESESNCGGCGSDRQEVWGEFCENIIRLEIEEREKREKEETERRNEQQKLQEEKERKKIKTITIVVVSAIIFAIMAGIAYSVIYRVKYGLSEEEKIQYEIAQSNYQKIEGYILELKLNYNDESLKYNNENHEDVSRLGDAEKDENYIYSRGIYIASSLLYELIEEQYPQKYHFVYEQLVKLHKGEIYNEYLINETLYVENGRAKGLLDKNKEINGAIDKMEEYMKNDTFNPEKVKTINVGMRMPNYFKVYGINLGILFYEDGNIRYIGEFEDGKANGYGYGWNLSEDANSKHREASCQGEFKDGVFQSGICFDANGNEIEASDLSNISFAGEFEVVKGLPNTASSESIAQQNADYEECDKERAQATVETYLDTVVKKQSSITNITWIDIPDITGDYYYFSCTVEFGDLKRKGTITVRKNSDGTFEVTGLDFDD